MNQKNNGKLNNTQQQKPRKRTIASRFDGFLPIVIDVETGGASPKTDALLEIAAFLIERDEAGFFQLGDMFHCHVEPFEGANLNPESMAVNRIDPYHPFRFAIKEEKAMQDLFEFVQKAIHSQRCRRAILVGHNAHFDLSFIQAAAKRSKLKNKNPFHTYTVFDTATLSGFFYGKTVLAKALRVAKIPFDREQAHSAIYDAKQTGILFCKMLNYRERNRKK